MPSFISQHMNIMDQCCNSKSSCNMDFTTTTRWWTKETVAIVTGGNKGIGYKIVKKLCELGLTVILTARDSKRGFEALQSLQQHRRRLHFFCLDVADPSSIKAFVSWFSRNFSALDILVNNAGVSFNEIGQNSVEKAETVMRTNYLGPKLLTESLIGMFRRCGNISRILNITSRLGAMDKLANGEVRGALEREGAGEEDIEEAVVKRFLESVKSGRWKGEGWPQQWTDYSVSKLALNAYTRVLGLRHEGTGLVVNSYCPGFTRTAMTGGSGTHSPRHAACVAAHILLLPPSNLPTARFFLCSSSPSTPLCRNSKL